MPEGDTIYKAAANLRKALQGRRVTEVTARPEVGEHQLLNATTVTTVEARGKHLIIHFDNDHALHSHMGMTGSWHIYPIGHAWHKPESQAVFVLSTNDHCVVCFTPKQIRLVTETELSRDNYLQRLGPDILGPPISDDVFLKRVRSQGNTAIGAVVMNQTVVCGIGNIYKSEILFREHIHPLTPTSQLTDEQLLKLRNQAVHLLSRNINNGPRRTRFRGDEQKLWVYQRQGQQCLKCGTSIEMIRQGDTARSTYYCPECQNADST